MLIIILIILFTLFIFWVNKRRKKLVISQVNLVTGAPKTGKTLLSLYLAKKDYNKRHFKWKIKVFFQKLLNKPLSEEPLFYSNIPVNFPYVEITKELLLRQERFNYNSVIFFDEAYILADSMSFGVEEIDDALSYFVKLIGHELRGGSLFLNTQNIKDCHFAFKRCATTYIYIRDKQKLPFFMKLNCRELYNTDDVQIQNLTLDDTQDDPSVKTLLVPKRYFRYYDCYSLSKLTDSLNVNSSVIKKPESLKTDKLLSLKKFVKEEKERLKEEKSKKRSKINE